MIYLLAFIGFWVVVLAAFTAGGLFIEFVIFSVKNWRRHYAYKHRFDKPPTAKCYCIDCKHWNTNTHDCAAWPQLRTADNWFCWKALPRKEEVLNDGRKAVD